MLSNATELDKEKRYESRKAPVTQGYTQFSDTGIGSRSGIRNTQRFLVRLWWKAGRRKQAGVIFTTRR
jgi:hypothetical protein